MPTISSIWHKFDTGLIINRGSYMMEGSYHMEQVVNVCLIRVSFDHRRMSFLRNPLFLFSWWPSLFLSTEIVHSVNRDLIESIPVYELKDQLDNSWYAVNFSLVVQRRFGTITLSKTDFCTYHNDPKFSDRLGLGKQCRPRSDCLRSSLTAWGALWPGRLQSDQGLYHLPFGLHLLDLSHIVQILG